MIAILAAPHGAGSTGQVSVGLLLGAVWSPCVGPTLGAASILAAQGRDLGVVGATMLSFGLGAGLPLAALGLLSREAVLRWRSRMMSGETRARAAFAMLLVARDFGRRSLAAVAYRSDVPVLVLVRICEASVRAHHGYATRRWGASGDKSQSFDPTPVFATGATRSGGHDLQRCEKG